MGQALKSTYEVNGKIFNIDSLNERIEFIMKDVGVPGLSLAVIDEGEIVFSNTYGYKDLNVENPEKINQETIFQAASLSKNFVTYAAFKLAEQGILNLDKPLYEYMVYDQLEHDERYKLITARMVLSHSSGIENHKEQNDEKLLEIFHEPGSAFRYSGEGYLFLDSVIKKILEKSTDEYLRELVYQPLKLNRTYTLGTGEGAENHASSHDQFGRTLDRWKNHIPWIESHIHTNAEQYANLLIAIFEGGLTPESVRQIWHPEVDVRENFQYGPGYFLHTNDQDTIAIQGGDALGFKGISCFSNQNRSGFVFFGNSERSEKIGRLLCEITSGMDISQYYATLYHNPYPTKANIVFNLYKEKGEKAARKKVNKFLSAKKMEFTEKDMVELAYFLKDENNKLAKYIATKYLKKDKDSAGKFVFETWLNKK